jgi:membrane protein YdbS with pleckstrin-like domain
VVGFPESDLTTLKPVRFARLPVPEPVETHTPDGIDYGWVMQVTFVTTILIGAPVVALLALFSGVSLPTWASRVSFAVRVGAIVWFVTAIGVFLYARTHQTPKQG